MRVWNSVEQWVERRSALSAQTIGFVPTMGALHRGHAALIERCRAENGIAVVSIFVNPLQFNDPKDLDRYPRTMERDLMLLENLNVDDVFVPSPAEMYPQGCRFYVEEASSTAIMEGLHRPGFFKGVMTVVLKLLNLVRADRAYFGEKDFQQLKIIQGMVNDFFIPTEIVACPTVREPSGLAESSRNALLSAAGRERAGSIFQVLTSASTPEQARTQLEACGFSVDYVEDHWGRRFAAASLEGVRLIDNVALPAGTRP
ncbi:MAG: pantoate--beta-alanine ligase [Bryobacterales bacterium]|nr:pantoate--beta-alanine ligase [Bryobacterales bacterium]MBV9399034.1 pantoate--beta-alanine ligase [Bryobacterales bacterium]